MKENKNRSGRPSQYDPDYHPLLGYRLCCLGMTNVNLAFIFEVTEQTVINWLNQHKDFSQSVKKGKAIADKEVIHSLYKRAIGYDHPETLIFELQDGEFKKRIQLVEIVRHYPPDVKACELWLRNRTNFFNSSQKSINQ